MGLNEEPCAKDFLRIHIRANSNAQAEQTVKYSVRDAVVEYLTPLVAQANDKEEALYLIRNSLKGVEQVSNQTLYASGFTYRCSARLEEEYFPTRKYDSLTLPSGYYDALILDLGSGEGDNWWCVVYPPLCFCGEGQNAYYKSIIVEKIKDWCERFD